MYISGIYSDCPLNEIIEEDIIVDFLTKNTTYLLYKENLDGKDTEYNIRKMAYNSYKEMIQIDIANPILKRVLNEYFNSNN
jgi:hypothetical protein